MSTRQTNYFLAPVGNPPEGPIRLGNIISTPAFVDDPINEEYIAPSEASLEVIEHNQTSFKFDMSVKNDRSVGVWASFLQILGVGGDANVEWSKESTEKWACEDLKTISFSPKISYISQCLKDEGVQSYMHVNKPWLGSSKLYMITGIKVAYGAASTIAHAAQKGLNLKFGADFTSLGVPISTGPQFGRTDTMSTQQSQNDVEPFVFAFRLRRIKISRKGDVSHDRYSKGTVLGIKEDEDEEDVEIVVEGVEEEDVDGDEFELDSKNAFDEGSLSDGHCKVVIVEEA